MRQRRLTRAKGHSAGQSSQDNALDTSPKGMANRTSKANSAGPCIAVRPRGRCFLHPLRCLVLSARVEAMKKRSKAGIKQAKAQPRKALKPKGRSAPKAMPRRASAPAGQETEVARLTRERDEALGQQAATADVLRIISSSPWNLDSVLETILANATRLCEANFGVLLLYESAQFCCNGKPLKSWVIF